MARRLADRYLLGEEIGSGGSSRVHTAHDERLGRQVAVKLLDARVVATADPAGRDRFLREGRTSAAFSHPNAVTVFDAGEDEGDLYIVMELVDGESLAQRLARTGPLPIDEVVRIARQLLGALSSAHTAGIVHRDVKPANVLLGNDGTVKLADFGIAKRFDDLEGSVTATGVVMGTPRYLSPEQAMGADTTATTDVYTMGVLLHEMLTGRTPFDEPAPDVLELRPDLPDPVAEVLARALRRDPAERYDTAVDMAEALDRATGVPGSSASAEAAVATQVMQAPPAAVSGVRSGHTEVLPVRPPPPDAASGAERPADGSTTSGSTRTTAAVMLAVLALVVGAIAIATMAGSSEFDGMAVSDPTTPQLTEPAATEPPVTEPVVTEPPVTEPVVTEPPVTEPVVTEPPVTEPPATEPPATELIPGFAATDDIEVFLEQLRNDPELVGESGEELLDDLEEVLEARGRSQRDDAEELRQELAEWVDDDEIHPAIAAALDDLLARLATPGDR